MSRSSPNPRTGMMKALLFSSATTPAQALWEARDKWGTVILVAGRNEVWLRRRSITLTDPAFYALVAVFIGGYPVNRQRMRDLTRIPGVRDKLRELWIEADSRDRWLHHIRSKMSGTVAPKPYPRPVATRRTPNVRKDCHDDAVRLS